MKDFIFSIHYQLKLYSEIFEINNKHLFKFIGFTLFLIYWISYFIGYLFIWKFIGEIFFIGILNNKWSFMSTTLEIMFFFMTISWMTSFIKEYYFYDEWEWNENKRFIIFDIF